MDKPVLDHDHRTGAYRDWICSGDNSALGSGGDDPLMFLEYAERATLKASRSSLKRAHCLGLAIDHLNRAAYLMRHAAQDSSPSS